MSRIALFKLSIKSRLVMPTKQFNIKGLTSNDVLKAREKYGSNKLEYKKENLFIESLKGFVSDPMILLLLVASSIYFFSGKKIDSLFLVAAIFLLYAISSYQNARSKNALEKLKEITKPKCKVIRNDKNEEIKTEDLVVGDSLIVEEGESVAADGRIVYSSDFSVNESILTGESMPIDKDKTKEDCHIYQGTTVTRGIAIAIIEAIGSQTKLGKIGKSLEDIQEEKTPLEIQINSFIKKMVIGGAITFLTVWAVNYFHTFNILNSLLKALTLAMSILPEEIPIAFATFMAIGAWRMIKLGIVVKQTKTVETLGSATVICTDKTGTITENKMSLAKLFVLNTNKISSIIDDFNDDEKKLITISMWASEPIPFDPMEVSLHNVYKGMVLQQDERNNYKLIHEYPLEGLPPMMTHIFENKNGNRIIAAKGAVEALINVCNLSNENIKNIQDAIATFAKDGYRILGVGEANFDGNSFPKTQQEFSFSFIGLIGLYDPPKKNIKSVLQSFHNAGIAVKIITGDNAATTIAIAKQIEFVGYEKSITGDELMLLNEVDLKQQVKEINVFTRMFPEAKLKIINALKANKEIVAMTGDGVNDGPALKAAHIGIAMGKKGTEIAKQAASLILLKDDLSAMVDAVAMGRKIFANLKKAIRFVLSIHIPIILTVFIPLVLGWVYPNIFSPIHIIFLELTMGPTCSIIYENEPMEKNAMLQKPRPFTNTFFSWKELNISIVQGFVITIGTLFIYQFSVIHNYNESHTRTMVFTTLIIANVFLTLVNRSNYYSIITTLFYKNNLVLLIISITLFLLALMLYVKPFTKFFEFEYLSFSQLLVCFFSGFVSVIWYEIVKIFKRRKGVYTNN